MTPSPAGPRRRPGAAPALLLAVLLAGCAAPPSERDFGLAVRQAMASQVLFPDAAGRAGPVAGMDGHSAINGLQQYEKSFSAPPANGSAFTIGVSNK